MRSDPTLRELLKKLEGYVMGPRELRCQRISWAYGQIALTRDHTEDELWDLRIACAKAADARSIG